MQNDFKIVGSPSWRNTLHNDARHFHHIDEIGHAAISIGYPYICWNDRIYAVSKDEHDCVWSRDTFLTIDDIA